MKILIIHNNYIHHGGEDACVENEILALRSAGLHIFGCRIPSASGPKGWIAALLAPFGFASEGYVESLLTQERPDIVHVHNTTPMLSPRLFLKARAKGIAVVQTLHNFRPICLNGLFLTPRGEVCERCTPGHYAPGIVRGCYRGSRLQSLGLALHLAWMKNRHAFEAVTRYIAPSQFLKDKYVQAGYPGEKIVVQGHFVDIPPSPARRPEPYVLYMGRLSGEKGIRWLATQFQKPLLPLRLKVAGQGPLFEKLKASRDPSIEYLGYQDGPEKAELLRNALALVVPSECYENFPLAIAEANLAGTPAIVPGWGGLRELIQPGINGLHYAPKDPASFWKALQELSEPKGLYERRQRCMEYAQSVFSKSHFLDARIKLYNSLL